MEKSFESEEASRENEKEEKETLSNKEKFEIILKLFGTDKARDIFIENCKKYADARIASARNAYVQNHGENYISLRDRYSPPKRAHYHNEIMYTLNNLSLQKLDPIQEMVLKEMRSSSETAWYIIEDWLLSQKDKKTDEENDNKEPDTWLYPSRRIEE